MNMKTAQPTLDDLLASAIFEAESSGSNASQALLKAASISARSPSIIRIAELAVQKLKEIKGNNYRSSVKPVHLPSYDEGYLDRIVSQGRSESAKRSSDAKKAALKINSSSEIVSGVVAKARLAMSILDEWMVGDKKLKDATRDDIRAAREADAATAGGLVKNIAFYEKIESKLPEASSLVGDHINISTINKIREEAYGVI